MGYIYIMTNKSFVNNLIKIGYSMDAVQRAKELYTTGVPNPFDIYCTYETTTENADKILHKKFGKFRHNERREFFQVAPEEVYNELSVIAKLSGTTDRLHLYKKNETEKKESIQQASKTNSCSVAESISISDDSQTQYFGPLHRPPFILGHNYGLFNSNYVFNELNSYIIKYNDKWHIINAGYADSSAHNITTLIFKKAYQLYVQNGFTESIVKFEMGFNRDEILLKEIMSELYAWGQSRAYAEKPVKEIPESDLFNYIQSVKIWKTSKIIEISFHEAALKMLQDNKVMIDAVIQHEIRREP